MGGGGRGGWENCVLHLYFFPFCSSVGGRPWLRDCLCVTPWLSLSLFLVSLLFSLCWALYFLYINSISLMILFTTCVQMATQKCSDFCIIHFPSISASITLLVFTLVFVYLLRVMPFPYCSSISYGSLQSLLDHHSVTNRTLIWVRICYHPSLSTTVFGLNFMLVFLYFLFVMPCFSLNAVPFFLWFSPEDAEWQLSNTQVSVWVTLTPPLALCHCIWSLRSFSSTLFLFCLPFSSVHFSYGSLQNLWLPLSNTPASVSAFFSSLLSFFSACLTFFSSEDARRPRHTLFFACQYTRSTCSLYSNRWPSKPLYSGSDHS